LGRWWRAQPLRVPVLAPLREVAVVLRARVRPQLVQAREQVFGRTLLARQRLRRPERSE
jgi:hypothetical protein